MAVINRMLEIRAAGTGANAPRALLGAADEQEEIAYSFPVPRPFQIDRSTP